ncbi:hypothetical protein HAZT_HAZT011596 [Hyalella azteca]|uniref:RRM domain-containing protein n=1 Tax=Hyalella azteca TaxID=294128 RepID=A0A6A0GQB4_HYAAZ|nr:hypothetical protein HAZT_HAZT011596 [Hyalella azteca]
MQCPVQALFPSAAINSGDLQGSNKPRFPTHSVHMRGLPFKATDYDVMDFFKPLETVNITFVQDNNGRASGEADVEFATHSDALKAMGKVSILSLSLAKVSILSLSLAKANILSLSLAKVSILSLSLAKVSILPLSLAKANILSLSLAKVSILSLSLAKVSILFLSLAKHKEHMKHRYIELFLNSSPEDLYLSKNSLRPSVTAAEAIFFGSV